MKKLVIIPTYNEIENVEDIIRSVMALSEPMEVLVVDDSSPDGTAERVKHLQNEFPSQLHLLSRTTKDGLGQAYLAGFRWAIERQYDFVFEMDADFSHNPKDLLQMYQACQTADMVVGSRYCQGVNVVNWPMGRVLLSYFASKYVRFVLGLPVHDTTAGFVGYKIEALKQINLDKIKLKGYGFQVEMKYRMFKQSLKLVEIPIIFTNRVKGQSKMNGGIIGEAVFGILWLRWKSLTHQLC